MAKLREIFDPRKINIISGDGDLPIGEHVVIITSSELVETQAKDGFYLKLGLKIIDGELEGTTGVDRLNLYNKNETAVRIAQETLAKYFHCLGIEPTDETEEMHNIPFLVIVGPQKKDATRTQVKKIMDANGNEPWKGETSAPSQAVEAEPAEEKPAATGFGAPPAQSGGFGQGGGFGAPPAANGGSVWKK